MDARTVRVETASGDAALHERSVMDILKLRGRIEPIPKGLLPNDGKMIGDRRTYDQVSSRKGRHQMPDRIAAAAALAIAAALPAAAQDAALIIGNENYRAAAEISAADDALDAARPLEGAGFVVRKGADLGDAEMQALLARHYDDTARPGRSVILLAGHFAHAGGETWLIGTDAEAPSLGGADAAGLPLSSVLAIAAERAGGAIVLLGTEDRRIDLGRGLVAGIGPLTVPQGVTVISGDAAAVAAFAATLPDRRGQTPAEIADAAEGLTVAGFRGAFAAFLPADAGAPAPAPAPVTPSPPDTGEAAFWQATEAIGNRAAYEAYLTRFPTGAHAADARAALAALDDPAAQARAAEEALGLGREQRRQIQRDLSILDIDPKGIDGLFGPGSRKAIAVWQRRNGDEATGFITAAQMATLGGQAARRAAELETEAAARKAEQDRQDRRYWDQTGAKGDEPGLRAYLKRYPDGLFAELAQERLAVFEEDRRAEAAAADRAAWDRAVQLNTLKSYQDYLAAYPKGAFVEEARRKIAELGETPDQEAARKQAEAQEAALNLSPVMRSLVEQRLAALGLKPGRADGKFDDDTRRAIRRYQQARGLPVTGYLNQQTVARLLVDSL
jgi:peptidoglycan hydrolase-like protein with peptidoglycan-binding domain